MMTRKMGVVLVVIMILMAGCTGIQGGDKTTTSTNLGELGMVQLGPETTIERNGTTFQFNGTIALMQEGADIRIDRLYICAYDNNKKLVGSQQIGPLYSDPGGESHVNWHINAHVQYLIVDHPKLRQFETSSPLWLRYDSEFDDYTRFSSEDVTFKFNVSEMKDGCANVSEA